MRGGNKGRGGGGRRGRMMREGKVGKGQIYVVSGVQ